jgi:hypothetical protein
LEIVINELSSKVPIIIYGYTGMERAVIKFLNERGKAVGEVYVNPPRIISLGDIYDRIKNLAKGKFNACKVTIESQFDVGIEIPRDMHFTDLGIHLTYNYSLDKNQEKLFEKLDQLLRSFM